MPAIKTIPWLVSDDCKATLLLCHEFGEGRLQGDAKPLTTWEYGQLVRFLQELGTRPSAVLQAETAEPILAKLPPELPASRVSSLLARGLSLSLAMETWRSRGIWVIGRGDPEYPTRLKEKFSLDAPPVLFGVGVPNFLDQGGLGVFGSRNVDEEGQNFAYAVGRRCAEEGITVLSGCARGVDWAAMSGCLEEGGRSIGVVAERLDRAAISSQFRQYIRQEQLVLISMFAPEAPFLAVHAKGRDKYTYALSDHGLVVSSEMDKGGTWAGATEQLKRLHHVPVYIRAEGHLPAGNPALLSMGGRPFPNHTSIPSLVNFFGRLEQTDIPKPKESNKPLKNEAKQEEIFTEIASVPKTTQKKKGRTRSKSPTPVNPAEQLADFANNLVAEHGGSKLTVEEAARILGVSVEQTAYWLKHGAIGGTSSIRQGT